jgi:hypothetical protein
MAKLKARGRQEIFRIEKIKEVPRQGFAERYRVQKTLMSDGNVLEKVDDGTWKVIGKVKPELSAEAALKIYADKGWRLLQTNPSYFTVTGNTVTGKSTSSPCMERTMTRNQWTLIGLGSASVIGLSWLLRRSPAGIEYRLHAPNKHGIVEADPAGLAYTSGAPLDQYALASAMQSEEKTDKGRLAVGRTIWNAVHQDRNRIVKKLLPHGHFATQESGQYAATGKPPTARTLLLAAAIIEERVPDMVHGAIQWDAPKTQDRLHNLYLKDPKKYPHYKHGSAEIAQIRTKAGAREIKVPGVPETRFWSYV